MVLKTDYPITPVSFTKVHVRDSFWAGRIETNRTVSIPFAFRKCEETGRVDNFLVAAGDKQGEIIGRYSFDDTDPYKIIEGAAYSLATHPDPELDAYLDRLIGIIGKAQAPDGYLFTWSAKKDSKFKERWAELEQSHETYNAGHLYEAAVAHFEATGKRSLLDIAIRNADLHVRTFGTDKLRLPSGHQEIEIGLVRLYRATGTRAYLDLARFFLEERGHHHNGRKNLDTYAQDHKPVLEQDEAVGHAVRAGYMYAAMADVAALTGDTAYIAAVDRLWDNVVRKKFYLNGGIGAEGNGERFDGNYILPNETAYNETCASIANIMWNHRMFLLHGDAKYMDVAERSLYNGFLAGVSLGGDLFFYPNPLASDGKTPFNEDTCTRVPWFVCSCCPGNVTRFIPSVPGYAYACRSNDLYVNLYMTSTAKIALTATAVDIAQTTRYPWDGTVKLMVNPAERAAFTLRLRVPGWAQGTPVPSDLYWYDNKENGAVELRVNGKPVVLSCEKGYAVISRTWSKGDTVELVLPMPVRRVLCNENVAANRGKIAIERGPIVYCAEGVDHGGSLAGIALGAAMPLRVEPHSELFDGVNTIVASNNGFKPLIAIPYYAWCHRGATEMAVWLQQQPQQ